MPDPRHVYDVLADRLTPAQLLELDRQLVDLVGVTLLSATVDDLDAAWLAVGLENAEAAANTERGTE